MQAQVAPAPAHPPISSLHPYLCMCRYLLMAFLLSLVTWAGPATIPVKAAFDTWSEDARTGFPRIGWSCLPFLLARTGSALREVRWTRTGSSLREVRWTGSAASTPNPQAEMPTMRSTNASLAVEAMGMAGRARRKCGVLPTNQPVSES